MAEPLAPSPSIAEHGESVPNSVVEAHLARADNVVGNLIHKLGESKAVKKTALLGATGLLMFNAACSSNDRPNVLPTNYPTASPTFDSGIQMTPAPAPPPESSPPSSEFPKSALQREIEQKYNINLVLMQEGLALTDWPYDESNPGEVGSAPPVRWTDDQLHLIDAIMGNLQGPFIEPKNGTKLTLMLADFGTNCPCAGAYFGEGVVGIQDGDFISNTVQDAENAASLVVHENTHRIDSLTDHSSWKSVKDIVGEFNLDKLNSNQNNVDDINWAHTVLTGLTQESTDGQTAEAIAGVSQVYALGKDRFTKAFGFYLGEEKAASLYVFYKNFFFGGKELNLNFSQLVNPDTPDKPVDALGELEDEYGIRIVNLRNIEMTPDELRSFGQILSIFPKNFYSVVNRGGWGDITIVLTDGTGHMPDAWATSPLIEWGGAVIETTDFKPVYSIQVNNMSSFFAEQLSHNAPVGSIREIPTDVLGRILDFYEIYRHPYKVLPNLKRDFRNYWSEQLKEAILNIGDDYMIGERTLGVLMTSYLGGRPAFFRDVVPVIGRKKANESYRLINGMFSGQEFSGNYIDGIPVPLSTPNQDINS